MSEVATMRHPMAKRPRPGQRVTVFMRDGRALDCIATMIVSAQFSGVMLYHRRKLLDEATATGWWPKVAAG